METIIINNTKLKTMKLVSNTRAKVYTKEDKMYKILRGSPNTLRLARHKILEIALLDLEYIEKPLKLIYMSGHFKGYVSAKVNGPTLDEYIDSLSFKEYYNLKILTNIYENIVKVIKNGHKNGIVFPDLGTLTNFIVTKEGYKYIDLVGLQVKEYSSIDYSNLLGNEDDLNCILENPKYLTKKNLFTPEIDKLSLIYLYFSLVFNINLSEKKELKSERVISKLFREINLKNYDLMHKVWLLNQSTKSNEFILDEVRSISENFTLTTKGTRRVLKKK